MTRLPSTDLYFRNACGQWIGRWWRRGWIRAIGANSFIAGDCFVLVRRDTAALMHRALRWPGRLCYVIDDDIAAGAALATLPPAYRVRLAAFAREWLGPLLARADVVLAASDVLADSLRFWPGTAGDIRRIDPVWAGPPADTAHFATLARGGTLHMAHLGTASHGAALAELVPLVLAALAGDAALDFTYFAAAPICPVLEAHPRARRIEPMTWPEYRRWLMRQRFHLALYPLGADRFDQARSASKVAEHAICGAAGLYPDTWRPAARIGAGAALFAPAETRDWGPALAAALADRAHLATIATRAQQALACQRSAAMQQALWHKVLHLG